MRPSRRRRRRYGASPLHTTGGWCRVFRHAPDAGARHVEPYWIAARPLGDVQRQRAEDRHLRRQLLVGPLGHQGAGALVGELAGLPEARAHGGRGRHRLHAADRPLEGLRRRHRLPRRDARDRDLGLRPAGRDRAHHRVRHGARAAVSSADRRQGVRHRRPHRRGPLRPQPRGRLERGRVRDVRRHAARARRPLRLSRRSGSTSSSAPGPSTDDFDFDGPVPQAARACAPIPSPMATRGRSS